MITKKYHLSVWILHSLIPKLNILQELVLSDVLRCRKLFFGNYN